MGNEVVAKGCGNCGHGTRNEYNTVNCAYDDGEAQNPANCCEEWCKAGSLAARLGASVDEEGMKKADGVSDGGHGQAQNNGFNLYALPGYSDSERDAIQRCYEHKQANREGEPGFDVSIRFTDEGTIKARVKVKLPNDVKFDLPEAGYIRENGTIVVTRAKQETLFDQKV